jgi:hypothetical protein
MATKPFNGKDTKAEERKEAKQVRSGKVTPAQYAAKEKAEGGAKHAKTSKSAFLARGKQLASGKMSGDQYAKKFGK